MTVTIEIGDVEYEIEVTHFDAGYPSSWDDPGAGAEIELDDTVKVWGMVSKEVAPSSFNSVPGVIERITMEQFLEIFAEFEGLHWKLGDSQAKLAARAKLEDRCIEDVIQQMGDDYDDRDL